tara:strand:+ start:143 stop:490 length:348 start_codon:yes stop_codon:yes gene_type:complete
MKKLYSYIFVVLMFCNVGFAEKVTMGFSGDSCQKFTKGKNEFGKEFDDLFKSEMMGFLTGYNMYVANHDGGIDKMKTLDHNSTEYAYSNIVEFCRKNPDDYVFIGLIEYYKSLPN